MNIVEYRVKGKVGRMLHISNPDKPKLVFLMGALQEIENITVFNTGFSEHYDYYAIEMPGAGRTMPVPPKVSVTELVDVFASLVNTRIRSEFILVACSYASAYALTYAKRSDSRVSKMVLPGAMYDIPLNYWSQMFGILKNNIENMHDFAGSFLDLVMSTREDLPRNPLIRKITLRKIERQTKEKNGKADESWHFIYNMIRLMTHDNGDLSDIDADTLVMVGEYDPYTTPELSKNLADMLPNGDFVVIPHCDHMFHLQDPKASIALIHEWIEAKALYQQQALSHAG